jgi:hypothetical protein
MNIRQSGRSRGRRNNNRPQNGMRGGDQGSRIDNRARGNAVQLHEKYKNMARDAQLQGDRVMSEYYNQFADHYFRVLSEHRARQEEQQAQQRARYAEDYGDEGDYADGDMAAEGQMAEGNTDPDGTAADGDDQDYGNRSEGREDGAERYAPRSRDNRRSERDGGLYAERGQNRERSQERGQDRGQDRGQERSPERDQNRERGPRRDTQRKDRYAKDVDVPESLDLAALPPALAPTLAPDMNIGEDGENAAPAKPKLRARKPRATKSDAAEAAAEA